jgi:spermidine/putrescine transport system ATP-binding protein
VRLSRSNRPDIGAEAEGRSESPIPGDARVDELAPGVPDVELLGVTKRFGSVTAVDAISLELQRGEFFSLLGPSGCGKTTTLRMIGGFEDPSDGVVRLGGQDVTHAPPYRRDVNTVFQSYALFPHLSVLDNVLYGLRRRHVPRVEAQKRTREVLELVSLNGYERRRPNELSGGQQQRVALARALVNHPRVLLLDEPMGALDAKLRQQMQREIKRIQREVEITFLYVTHDQDEAMMMSDRLAVMNDGRIEAIGRPEEVYERPATAFVASFLGRCNLVAVQRVAAADATEQVLAEGGTPITVSPGSIAQRPQSTTLAFGVRPEKIKIEPGGAIAPDGWNAIGGTVRSSVYLGATREITVDGPFERPLVVHIQNGAETAQWPEGTRVLLTWSASDTFLV